MTAQLSRPSAKIAPARLVRSTERQQGFKAAPLLFSTSPEPRLRDQVSDGESLGNCSFLACYGRSLRKLRQLGGTVHRGRPERGPQVPPVSVQDCIRWVSVPCAVAADSQECAARAGEEAGRREGAELGVQKGLELGSEVGYYSGCVQVTNPLVSSLLATLLANAGIVFDRARLSTPQPSFAGLEILAGTAVAHTAATIWF